MIWLLIMALATGYVWGEAAGFKDAEKIIDGWIEHCEMLNSLLFPDDPDDEDGDALPIIEAEAEPVKAMAKASGTYK